MLSLSNGTWVIIGVAVLIVAVVIVGCATQKLLVVSMNHAKSE